MSPGIRNSGPCFAASDNKGIAMRMAFSQIYGSVDAQFPFSFHFQVKLTNEISARVNASQKYIERYGSDFDLIVRISAKRQTVENEIRGPIVYRKSKDVEFVIFLPYDAIVKRFKLCASGSSLAASGCLRRSSRTGNRHGRSCRLRSIAHRRDLQRQFNAYGFGCERPKRKPVALTLRATFLRGGSL
jgi:hypothetical protein